MHNPVRLRTTILTALFTLPVLLHAAGSEQTRVALDHGSFGPDKYRVLQPLADSVASAVDKLIPGHVAGFPNGGIFFFVAPADWYTSNQTPPPITLLGPRRVGEPLFSPLPPIRIAL